MPDSYQALVVAVASVLPGALYVLAFERSVGGSWGVNLSDRITRFLVVSAVLHVLVAPLTAYVVRSYVLRDQPLTNAQLPSGLWLAMLAYVIVPIAAGSLVGVGVNADAGWARPLAGRAPQPRAWDFVWGSEPSATVRLRLKSGAWVAGVYGRTPDGRRPFAGGFPEPGDLYLPRTAAVDPDSGEYLVADDGSPLLQDAAILVRWDEIEYLVLDF